MREILFRGKRKVCDEWVYGFPFISRKGEYKIKWYDAYYGSSKTSEIYTESIGQFTGLTDKNGKKIFDGDIIEAIHGNTIGECIEATVVVRFDDYELMWDIDHSLEIEVIGNIHDNPELLNGGNENG